MIKDHVLLPQASQLEEVDKKCKTILNEESIRNIVKLIPDVWLLQEVGEDTPEAAKEVYVQFLIRRIENSSIFVNEAQHARNALV